MRRVLSAALLCCAWSALPAGADDVEVHADTTLQAYDVASPATSVVWTRRRLTQALDLRYLKPLGRQTSRATPALRLHVRLRLDQDFGDSCLHDDERCFAVVSPSRRGSYTPVVDEGLLDLPLAYAVLQDVPRGATLRTGRLLHDDLIGVLRIDGVAAEVDASEYLRVTALAGALVRRQSVAGSDGFVLAGPVRLDLPASELARSPYAQPPVTTLAAGAGVELGDLRYLRATLGFRELREHGDMTARRAGIGLVSQPAPALRLDSHAVLALPSAQVVAAQVGTTNALGEWTTHAGLERRLPVYDASSVWAYFDVAPLWLATASVGRAVAPGWDASVGLRGRRTELQPDAEHDAGADAAVTHSGVSRTLSLSGFGFALGPGPLWGVTLAGSQRVSYTLTLEAEASLVRIDDHLRRAYAGVSVFELLAARLAITDTSDARVQLSHSYGDAAGHRLSLLAFLHVGAFR